MKKSQPLPPELGAPSQGADHDGRADRNRLKIMSVLPGHIHAPVTAQIGDGVDFWRGAETVGSHLVQDTAF